MKYLFFSLCTMYAVFTSAQQFLVQPATLSFSAAPGQTQAIKVQIFNKAGEKYIFQATMADWLRDSSGSHLYFRPDTLSRSCAAWVSIDKPIVEVPAHHVEEILVTLKVPGDKQSADEMKWAMLFLQTIREKEGVDSQGKAIRTEIKELFRVGIHIYQTPPGVTLKTVQTISLRENPVVKNAFDFTVANTGSVMSRCKSSLALTNINSGREYKVKQVEFPVFPGANRVVTFVVPAEIPRGPYSALAVVDYGEDYRLEAIEKNILLW